MKKSSSINFIYIGSYLFLIGSIIFTFEAVLEIIKENTFLTVINFLACLLFTIGSWLFLYSSQSED